MCTPAQERLHKRLDALQAKAAASPARKPTADHAAELAAVREALATREAEAAELRSELAAAKQAALAALPAQMQSITVHPAAEPVLCASEAAEKDGAVESAITVSCAMPPAEAAHTG